jgi:hypothetical protein
MAAVMQSHGNVLGRALVVWDGCDSMHGHCVNGGYVDWVGRGGSAGYGDPDREGMTFHVNEGAPVNERAQGYGWMDRLGDTPRHEPRSVAR